MMMTRVDHDDKRSTTRGQSKELDNERSMMRGQQQQPRGQQHKVNNERSMTRGERQEADDEVDNEMIKYFNTT